MGWFKNLFHNAPEVVVPPVRPVEYKLYSEPEILYSTKEYTAYPEAIPHYDGTFTVRFYSLNAPIRLLEEHTIIGEAAKNKLINEYMPRYKKV